MAPTSAPPFTFASPTSFSSETHEDAALVLDYESWIQQSKIANANADERLWMDEDDAEVINRHHREMMLRMADNLPEEAYELSLRDIAELSLPPPPPPPPPPPTRATTTKRLHCWHKTTPSISMEGPGGFIIKLFMPSPFRAAAASSSSSPDGGGRRRRNKSFSSISTIVPMLPKKSASANHGRERSRCMENDTNRNSNGYDDSTKRKSVRCYPFFNSSKHKAKHKFTGSQ